MTLSRPVERWFLSRAIEPEVAISTGVYTGSRLDTGVVEPDPYGNIIVFPIIREGQVVGEKYRAANKTFWQKAGGLRSFINSDVLSASELISGEAPLVITEGEPDMLSAIQCGFPFTVSVPDGAPPVPKDPSQPAPDYDQKLSFILLDWERLKLIKRIIIATDNDAPGRLLAEELVRRLGRVRCHWLDYPKGCKDLNAVHMEKGASAVIDLLKGARPYPVQGLFKLSEFPPEPELLPLTTGWPRLDNNLKVFYPCLMVVTGFAGAGKSTWANQLVGNLAREHGWRAAIASFEMRLDPYVTDTLRTTFLRKPRSEWSSDDYANSTQWLEENFAFISPTTDDDSQKDIDWLIERAEAAVIRHGIRVLLIDPWNEIEHSRQRGESVHDYTGRALQRLKSFGRNFDCLVIVVAHPTKEGAKKSSDQLTLYDISDTAHFANKADLGVVLRYVSDGYTQVLIRKVRFQPDTGRRGDIDFSFDTSLRLFAE